jgi:hypothetical protein
MCVVDAASVATAPEAAAPMESAGAAPGVARDRRFLPMFQGVTGSG